MMKKTNTPTIVILTENCNFGITVKVYNIKFNNKKYSFTFDIEIIDNPFGKPVVKKLIQDEVFSRIMDSFKENDII